MTVEATIESPDNPRARARWTALWENSPQRSPFSSFSYAVRAARTHGLRVGLHFVRRKGRDEAAALVAWRRRGPWREALLPPFTQYSALLLGADLPESAVHARTSAFEVLLAALERSYHRIHLMADLRDVRPASWRGWRVEPLYTYRLAPGAMRPSESTGRAIRAHGAEFRVVEDPADAPEVVSLCTQSYRRKGRALPADPERLLELARFLESEGMVRVFTARRNGAEAGVAILHDGRTAHYWIAGGKPGPAMTVLLGRALPLLAESGIKTFDFTGANSPTVAEFKRRFGPRLKAYSHLRTVTRPELRLLAHFAQRC